MDWCSYVANSRLSKSPQWQSLYTGFVDIAEVPVHQTGLVGALPAEIPCAQNAESLLEHTNKSLESRFASHLVFGHFDVNTGNIMVRPCSVAVLCCRALSPCSVAVLSHCALSLCSLTVLIACMYIRALTSSQ